MKNCFTEKAKKQEPCHIYRHVIFRLQTMVIDNQTYSLISNLVFEICVCIYGYLFKLTLGFLAQAISYLFPLFLGP